MDRRKSDIVLSAVLLILCTLIVSGCVEVTPPSGTQEASSYGPVGTGGNLTDSLDQKTPGPSPVSSQAPVVSQNPVSQVSPGSQSQGQEGPEGKIPPPPSQGIVQVTPRSMEGLPVATPTSSYSSLTENASIGPEEGFVTIYEMNHSYVNDAVAYAYTLEQPPLYVDISFEPVYGQDVISFQKRTGDKEGQIDVTVNRPLKDAWFEMIVYNMKDGSEILREGYGKTYSQSNKTFALRTSGSYQFDMLGNKINATVQLKVPRSMADIAMYQNVSGMLSSQKENEGKIPEIFLVVSDLQAGWTVAGDVTRTETEYQSLFQNDYITLRQKINKYDSTQAALAELERKRGTSGTTAPSLVGQSGFQEDSASKSQLVFVQGLYLVELSSFSAPNHVSLADLQSYGRTIISKISST